MRARIVLTIDVPVSKTLCDKDFLENFEFCICILPNLCYRGFIPLDEAVETASPESEAVCVTGLPARTA